MSSIAGGAAAFYGDYMIVTLDEIKNYLRVDNSEDDELLNTLIASAEKLCSDVARVPVSNLQENCNEYIRLAVMYAVAYLYEHREEADHNALVLTLRSLLFGIRQEEF